MTPATKTDWLKYYFQLGAVHELSSYEISRHHDDRRTSAITACVCHELAADLYLAEETEHQL